MLDYRSGKNVEIFYYQDLQGLDEDGRDCEACGEHMHNHDWAALDDYGFVVYCSNDMLS